VWVTVWGGANCLAQAQAFMAGYDESDVRGELEAKGFSDAKIAALLPHKLHPGSRPVTLIAFDRLDPRTLGLLVAMYEHTVYVQAVIWDLNPFDQWGVELGKKLASELAGAVTNPDGFQGGDASIRGLLDVIARWR
jgi:glucose-6-phosphate isomerase